MSGRGLSNIPAQVKRALDSDTLKMLAEHGHGISFPSPGCCQLRVIRNKKNLGGTYNYKLYGGVGKAVRAAISRSRQLKAVFPGASEAQAKKDYVHWSERLDKRNNKMMYSYRVYYQDAEGKKKPKEFGFGYRHPCPDKQLHGYRTARLFRHFVELYGKSVDIHWFADWKEVRLYENARRPFDWKNA